MTINRVLPEVDILKIAQDELLFLMKKNTLEEAVQELARYQIPYVWVTLGKEGAVAVSSDKKIHAAGENVKAVDTTGAGDAFMAGILHCFNEHGPPANQADLTSYTNFANKLGTKATTQFGALH